MQTQTTQVGIIKCICEPCQNNKQLDTQCANQYNKPALWLWSYQLSFPQVYFQLIIKHLYMNSGISNYLL